MTAVEPLACCLDPDNSEHTHGLGRWLGPPVVRSPGPVRITGGARAEDDGGCSWTVATHPLDAGVRTITLTTDVDRTFIAAGLDSVHVGLSFDPTARPEAFEMRAFGHQHTEFGLPTQCGGDLDRWFLLPGRPRNVWPLWLCAADGPVVLLAPLDSFHEQVVVVPDPGGDGGPLHWGWHGDLSDVPAGFSSTLGILVGDSPRTLLERWAALLPGTSRLPVDADTLGRRVSYWTDNGAAYWYRTEPPRTVTETVVDAVASVESAGIPIGAVQLDSWWYPHEVVRPFDTDDWVVPPTGLVSWTPRGDILPDGLDPLVEGVGRRPLVTHCRHLSSTSPEVARFDCWIDGDRAHPTGADYYEALLDRARAWGVETFEHDWLVECFTGVRGLRAAPGRARRWQEGIDRAAAERAMTLQWCMATPADFAVAASLPRVTSVRTSGDHGYIVSPGFLWAWFCATNSLARALGLVPFKDVFLSGGEHGEVEALLSALSTGPVGVGDAIGTTDATVVRRTCRADGVIVRPDVPVAMVDACYRAHPVARPVPLVAECFTDHTAGRWTHVFSANAYRREEPVSGLVDLGPSWPTAPCVALDLRHGSVSAPAEPWSVIALAPGDWQHHLLAPLLDHGRLAVFGDLALHAPVGRVRTSSVVDSGSGVVVTVEGAPGEPVTVSGWAPESVIIGAEAGAEPVGVTRSGDRWSVVVTAPATLHLTTT